MYYINEINTKNIKYIYIIHIYRDIDICKWIPKNLILSLFVTVYYCNMTS